MVVLTVFSSTFTTSFLHFQPSTALLFNLRSKNNNGVDKVQLQQILRAGDFACEPSDHAKDLVLSAFTSEGNSEHVMATSP